MADAKGAKWSAVMEVDNGAKEMVGKERTCELQWAQSLQRKTKDYMLQKFVDEHMRLVKSRRRPSIEMLALELAMKLAWCCQNALFHCSASRPSILGSPGGIIDIGTRCLT